MLTAFSKNACCKLLRGCAQGDIVSATLSIQVSYSEDALKGDIVSAFPKRYRGSCSKDALKGNIVLTALSTQSNCLEDALIGVIVSTSLGMRKLVAIAAPGMRKLVAIAAQGGLRHLFLLLLTLLFKAIVLCIAILSTVTVVESWLALVVSFGPLAFVSFRLLAFVSFGPLALRLLSSIAFGAVTLAINFKLFDCLNDFVPRFGLVNAN